MQRVAGWAQRLGQQLAGQAVAAQHVAIGVQRQQAVGLAAQRAAGPVQVQQQRMGPLPQQGVFHGAGRPGHQVAQFGALGHVHAGQVQHADALPVGPEQRCARAAVAAVVVKEMLAPVQPHGLQFGQRGADGGGAHGGLRQVDAHAANGAGAGVAAVAGALHVHHDAVRVGQDGKVAHARNGAGELVQHGPGRVQQVVVLLLAAAQGRGAHHVKGHRLRGLATAVQAALPRARNPGLQGGARGQRAVIHQGAARLGDEGVAVVVGR